MSFNKKLTLAFSKMMTLFAAPAPATEEATFFNAAGVPKYKPNNQGKRGKFKARPRSN